MIVKETTMKLQREFEYTSMIFLSQDSERKIWIDK